MLYDLNLIEKKAFKLYNSGELFLSFIQDKSLFPYTISLKKPTQKSVLENLENISKELRKLESFTFSLEYKTFDFKSIGIQKLPISLTFESQANFLSYIKKEEEFHAYKNAYYKVAESFKELKQLFLLKPNLLLQNMEYIEKTLKVCGFLKKSPQPNIYIRELPIKGVDTKFIQNNRSFIDSCLEKVLNAEFYNADIKKLSDNGFEKKYGFKFEEPLIRFRILDESLYINGLSDISLPLSEFASLSIKCKTIYIVENKITTLSFPPISNSIVIFGKGYGVGILKDVEWMKDKNIFYWGDIDIDGFAILSQVRSYFSQVQSLMMNLKTVETFEELAVSSENKIYKNLDFLNDEENVLYERLYSDFYKENFRLEQEKIPIQKLCINLLSLSK